MASVNKVILVGNLGRDPEVRYTPDGSAICNISIATTSQWKDRNTGERREDTEGTASFSTTAWPRLRANTCAKAVRSTSKAA